MLKMTEMNRAGGIRRLKLEGRVAGPWVDELRRVAETWLDGSEKFHLDLSEVTYVDARGADLLRRLVGRQVELHGSTRFVTELLGGEDPRCAGEDR